jgi:hypothetical protein
MSTVTFKEIALPSGAILKVAPAPFAVSKALYQAILREIQHVPLSMNGEMGDLLKSLFCVGFSSLAIEACLKECFKRCLYVRGSTELKIDDDTFEPVAARDDYLTVCKEVAQENIFPFVKSLYAVYQEATAAAVSFQKSKSPTTT